MQTQARVAVSKLSATIAASQDYLLAQQHSDGYWWSELESNVTITAEVVLLHKIWCTDFTLPQQKIINYLRTQQCQHGGWELFFGDGGDLSTSVEAYMALRLLGVGRDDPALLQAKRFILSRGGISKTRIFTKLHLALIGCYQWRGLPSLPPWVMLLPDQLGIIYEMSSWARSSTVPLLVVFDQKPVYKINPAMKLDELYSEGINNVVYELPSAGDGRDIFLGLDQAFKFAEMLNLVPFRSEGIAKAEKWILERQEASGDWGGIIPAMLNSLLALRCLGYDRNDPIVVRGLKAIANFSIETSDEYGGKYWVQPCISPVWDTAWVMRSLVASGLPKNHPSLVKAGEWLLDKQILDYGDWWVKNPQGKPGGWAFEFENRFYPDVDDTAVVVMALAGVELPNEAHKHQAMKRAVNWITTMQCRGGGWAAFDINNDQDWLNAIPYGDLNAMIDPNTADVTARVIEMLGISRLGMAEDKKARALQYLLQEQEADGSWFGRWGVNYIYGTSGALAALAAINSSNKTPAIHQQAIRNGAKWLTQVQNPDGGWGETCRSYNDPNLKGKGDSTASQTAWALIGLLAANSINQTNLNSSQNTYGDRNDGDNSGHNYSHNYGNNYGNNHAIAQGISYLIDTQQSNGSWDEPYFTGTGFPGHFYLKYHMYQQYFPLIALGQYAGI